MPPQPEINTSFWHRGSYNAEATYGYVRVCDGDRTTELQDTDCRPVKFVPTRDFRRFNSERDLLLLVVVRQVTDLSQNIADFVCGIWEFRVEVDGPCPALAIVREGHCLPYSKQE